MALVSVAASYIGSLTGVSALIWGLLLGITLKELGFLEEGGLVKAGGFSWMMAATLTVVFSSLPSLDLATLKELALPLVLLSVIGFSYDLTGGYRLASAAGVVCGALGLICTGILRKKLRTK